MSTLKLTPSYLNSYEAAHKILSNNPWFQESDWLAMARSGELDQYITVLANTDKITDKDKFYSDYNYAYADDQTRVAALYNELLADRSNVDEPRKRLALDSSGNVILDAKGKPTYESFKASDYDYYKSVIKNRNDEHYQEYLIEQEKERKNSMNGFVKFLGDTASIGTELAYGLANQIDNLTNSIAAIGDGITAYFKDEDVADAIVDTNASDTWRWFEQLGVQDWIVDFERRYTNVRDLDGNYSNTGKYLGGICSTLGQMLPSMVGGKVVGSAAQKAGAAAKTVNTLSQISSTLIFYQGITAGNIRDMYKQFAAEKASVPSGAILANASIKSALQWAVEIGLAKISGGSTIDNVVFGRSVRTSAGSTLAKSAGKRLLSDFVTEGLEEVFQDTSDWLVDKAFSVLINENFGKVTEISYQSLMDSFIIGGLASFAGSALNIVTTKKVATGQVKTNKKGDTKLDKEGNVKAEKLGKLASWEYGLDMQSFMKNYVELQEQAKGFLKRYDKDSNEAKKYAAAITEMYAAYRMLSSVYGEIGETRFKNANQVLSEITNLVNNGKFTNDSAYNIGQELMNSLTDLRKNSLEKTLVALEKAKITQLADVIERDSDLTQLNIDEDTKKSIQQLFDGDDNVKKVILTKDGANIAVVDDSLFVPINYAKNADGSTLYETVAEQTLVEAISKGKFKGDVLNLVLETFKKVTGRNDASMEEAIYNLVFNDSFFNIMLSTANKDMYSLLSSLISIEDNVVSNKLRDKIYKKKIATVVESMTQSLYDYCINQPYADYRLDVFTKTQIDKIAATRWCRNLYARVIDNTSYKHLTDNDWNVLNNRVNSLPVSQQQKDKILTALKSSNKDTRASAMNKIALVYKGIFTTNYDGTVYMPDTNTANRTFNSWLQSMGLTIETLTSLEIDENTKKTISELYGAFTTENLIKFRQSQFMQYCNNSFIFRYDKQGKLGIYEHETNKQVGFSEYRTNAEAVLAGNDFDKRTTLERSYKKNYLVKEILNNEIDAATAAYLSIDDVISNPSLLSEKMLADIQMTYGDVNQTSTFLYLRDYFINKFKTATVVVLSDGTYGFADIRPMKSMLKTENFIIDKNTKIKDIIKDDCLKGRLKDVKIKLTDRGIVAEYNAEENTIYINEFRAAKKGPYLTFAVLHEFQHAIQVENGMNLGMNVNWINSVAKTTKAAIIADVRKHRPELFTDVAKGSKDEANIVNNFVYYSSGESTAYGIDASQLVNYYPTVVNADKGIKITFPWGKTYNISSNVPVSIKLRNLYNKVFTLLNESNYEKYFNAIKDTTDITPFSSQVKSLEIYRNLLDSIKEISEYISVGLGTVQDVSEVKQRLFNRITPDVKNQMLKMMYFKLGMTSISFDEFLQMDIPFVRVQNNITSKPDAFLSASVTMDANLTLDKCLDFIMKTDIVKGRNNEQVTPTDKLTIVVGTIKPADCIGFLGTKLDEVLLPVDVVNKSKKYTIDINDYVPTGNPEPVYEFVETIDKVFGDIIRLYSTFFSRFDIKDDRALTNAYFTAYIRELGTARYREIMQLYRYTQKLEDTHGKLDVKDSEQLRNARRKFYELITSDKAYKIATNKIIRYLLSVSNVPDVELSEIKIPVVRVQKNNFVDERLPYVSCSLFLGGDIDNISILTDVMQEEDANYVFSHVKVKDIVGFVSNDLREVLVNSSAFSSDDTIIKHLKANRTFEFGTDDYDSFERNVFEEEGSIISEYFYTYSELGPSDSMSIKQPGDIETKRYVTQKEGKDTNLEKYGYTAKYKRTQMDTKLKNFIINANEDIASELWNKVKSGKITTSDVMDYLRDADKIDDKTFKLINDSFFKNSKIKTFEELKAKIAESSKYYAMRAVLKSAGFGEALLTNANPELFNAVLEIINKDEKLKKLFDEIDSRYYTYRQQGLDISEKYLRKLWMEYFDGTVAAGGYIAAIAKIAAISKWKVTGEGSTISTRSLDDTVGKDMALEEVLEDVSAKDAFSYILNNGDRSDKIDDIIKAVTPKIIKKLREMGPLKAEKYLQQKREQLEEMSDRDFIKSYKKYVEGQSEEEINKMFLKTIIVETGAIDISKLSDQQLDQLEITANTISKKVDRPNTAVVNNIKSLVRTIKANLSKKDTTRFLKDNGDIFDNNLDVKKDLYQTVDDKGRIRLKDASELLELENRVRQLSKSVRANDYSSDQSLRFRKKMNRELEKLRIENEHLAEKLGKDKGHVQPIVYEIADDVITIDTKKEIPLALKRILEHQFTKTAKTKVQYLSEKDEQHVKMNFKSFIADNVENLLALTQSDVDQIIDFYLTSDILTGTNKYRQYIATEIYLGTYILTNAKSGRFLLTDEQYSNLNDRIKTVVSTGTAAGAAWKSVLPMLKPEETLIQSAAKSTGIEFAVSDVQALVEATNSGDIERIQAAKTAMYENALKSYKGIKRSFFDRLLKFERMAMLSGPGTWVRNQVSNLMVVTGNKTAEYVSGPIVKMLDKLFPKTFKHRDKQYKLIGTKVTSEVQTFIKREIIDSKLLELIRDGFSKYDTRKYKPNEISSEQSLSDLIQNSIRSKIMKDTYSNSKVVNETYKFLFKMLSDDKYIDRAAIKYLGKILTEDNVNLNEGLSTDVINHIADAYVMAAQDFMHTTNFFNDIETKLRERLGDKAFFMYKQIMPFAAASWNWFVAGLKYTPVGLVQGIYQYAKLENTIEKIEKRKQKGEQVASSRFAEYIAKRNIGKGVIGTIGCAIGIALAAFGVAGIDEEDGKYKLRVGDVYVDISDIFSTQGIFVGIAAFSSIKSGDIWSAMGNVLDVMFLDSTFTDMFNSFRYSETFGDWLRDQPFSILSMFIPNMLKVLTSTTYGHKVQYSKGILGKLERIAAQSVPGMAYALPKQYDPYTGEYQIQYKVWFLTKLVDKLSPLDIYAYNISEQEKIAMSLGVKKGPLTGRYKINGEKINLNSKELSEANKFYGELNSKDLKEFTSGTKKYKVFDDKKGKYVELTYSKMTDKQKAAVIDRIMSNNSSKAQIYILTKHGYYKYYASQEEYKELKKLGINVQKATGNKKGFLNS